MNIYVGNIPRETTESAIREEFQQYGEVTSVNLIKDKFTNMLKGFGFVEMPNKEEAMKAVEAINGKTINGRQINAAEAKPREERPAGNRQQGGYNSNRNRSW